MPGSSWRAFVSPVRDLAALVWSGPCHACGGDLPLHACAGVCAPCWADLATLVLSPADAPAPVACFAYADRLTTLHRLGKFQGKVELVAPLARRMALVWRRARRPVPELLVPVPSDPLRLPPRRRFVPLLAEALGRELGLPVERRGLRKVRSSPSQTGRRAEERRSALVGLFAARRERMRGRRVLLVDDVTTTGATLRECGQALVLAGAQGVDALALAATPLRSRGAPPPRSP